MHTQVLTDNSPETSIIKVPRLIVSRFSASSISFGNIWRLIMLHDADYVKNPLKCSSESSNILHFLDFSIILTRFHDNFSTAPPEQSKLLQNSTAYKFLRSISCRFPFKAFVLSNVFLTESKHPEMTTLDPIWNSKPNHNTVFVFFNDDKTLLL